MTLSLKHLAIYKSSSNCLAASLAAGTLESTVIESKKLKNDSHRTIIVVAFFPSAGFDFRFCRVTSNPAFHVMGVPSHAEITSGLCGITKVFVSAV